MKLARTSLAVAGAVALVSIGAAAHAGPPFTVLVDNQTDSTPRSFNASTTGLVEWSTPGVNFACDEANATGTITPGATATKLGEITGTTSSGCTWALGIQLLWTQTSAWDIHIVGNTSGVLVPVMIRNISYRVENPDGVCAYDVAGSVAGTFNMQTQQLAVDGGGTTISNVEACYGLHQDGDPHDLSVTFQLEDIGRVLVAN